MLPSALLDLASDRPAAARHAVEVILARPLPIAPLDGPAPIDKAGFRALADRRMRERAPAERTHHAHRLAADVTALALAMGAARIGLYSAIGAEVDTRPLADALLAQGLLLAYPRLQVDGTAMDFVACEGPASLLPRPRSRLLEPAGDPLDPADLDLVVVPALAMRGDLVRLGRGGGHFDRYLPRLRPDVLLVGCVAGSCVLAGLPDEPHDVRLSCACTEAGLFGPAADPEPAR